MQLRLERGHADEQLLAGDPVRKRRHAHVALDPRHHLPAPLVTAERPGRAVEPDSLEVIEKGVDTRGVIPERTPHGVADADHLPTGSHATGKGDLGLGARLPVRHTALSPNRCS